MDWEDGVYETVVHVVEKTEVVPGTVTVNVMVLEVDSVALLWQVKVPAHDGASGLLPEVVPGINGVP